MSDGDGTESLQVAETMQSVAEAAGMPLVFISHDSRDAAFAEAFSKLLRSVSLGMLKSFRSSDKKGTEGIEYGDEWYKRLMSKLGTASDVVCLFTGRSLDRPWILYEAGVAKGKLGTPVYGIALGISLSKVSSGPFYQFQNSGDSEDELTKLVLQLARRVKGADPDEGVVRSQVAVFKNRVDELLEELGDYEEPTAEQADDAAIAKLFEEVKVMFRDLPVRIDSCIDDARPSHRRQRRRIHPGLLEELMFRPSESGDPIGLLVVAGLIRDEAPWMYEIALEVYRGIRSGSQRELHRLSGTVRDLHEYMVRGNIIKELFSSEEMIMVIHELPRMLDEALNRAMEAKKTNL